MVAPGLAGLTTIMALHSADRIGHDQAVWGVRDGNPVFEDVRRCAQLMPPHLALDVLVDRRVRVCGLAAGELFAVHRVLCDRALGAVMVPVDDTFDVVVTTNGGYPLDQNLYQAVKGLAAAERIVHDGSIIVLLAECSDGLPDGSPFAQLLGEVDSVGTLLERLDGYHPPQPEQWQVQVLARILRRARVFLHCRGLDETAVRSALLEPCPDPAATVAAAEAAAGPGARVAYLPAGPYAVPYRRVA
jgi:nickel-dependent lactate racemase